MMTQINTYITKTFPTIKSEEELLGMCNEINKYLHEEKAKPISLRTLKYYKNIKLSGAKRYKSFSIKKKSGKDRQLSAPAPGLKLIQQCLNAIFQAYYVANDAACGFVPNKNITDGAKLHTNQAYVYNIDLKDFFDTITFPRVKKVLSLPPFNLKDEREPLGYVITSLCCHPKKLLVKDVDGNKIEEIKNCLPQGAPTSPILTNIVCRNLDRHLAGLAKRFRAQYSRYADDITFSCNYNIFKSNSDFLKELHRIIEEEQGLQINPNKTRMQTRNQRQEVTGLKVNKKVNINTHYVKQLRLWLHYWEVFGVERAQQYFVKQYIKDRGHVKSHNAHIENVIGGKLDYMRMVLGENNPAYKKLKTRYDNLIGNNNDKVASKTTIGSASLRTTVVSNRGIKMLPEVPTLEESDDKLLSLLDELINNL